MLIGAAHPAAANAARVYSLAWFGSAASAMIAAMCIGVPEVATPAAKPGADAADDPDAPDGSTTEDSESAELGAWPQAQRELISLCTGIPASLHPRLSAASPPDKSSEPPPGACATLYMDLRANGLLILWDRCVVELRQRLDEPLVTYRNAVAGGAGPSYD